MMISGSKVIEHGKLAIRQFLIITSYNIREVTPMVDVKGRWALITGTSRGIGALTAEYDNPY